jgi:transcriptional regulator with XRE-family HTH domain
MYQRMKDLREDNDLKQKEVAEVILISRSAYANYERGIRDISAEVLGVLADFYDTSVDYIMGRTDEKSPYPKTKKVKH